MRINAVVSEGQAIELLVAHFNLAPPVSFNRVKRVYRAESKRLHPDIEGGSEEGFKALTGAFDKLKNLYQMGSRLFDADPTISEENGVNGVHRPPCMPRQTVDGTPLSELGLGLGPTASSRDCAECNHDGYRVVKEHSRAPCRDCKGSGKTPREFSCQACQGSGKFLQRHTQRLVECRVCGGTSRYRHPHLRMWCSNCLGLGTISGEAVMRIYALKCGKCDGKGEIEIWNPVIPKGRLSFGTSN